MDKQSVLIVEDDSLLRSILRRKLEVDGYLVYESADGEQALELVSSHLPNVVLLDLLLPGISGFDVLESLKGDTATSGIPVIIVSNLGSEEDIRRGKALGATKYILKAQADLDDIVGEIRSILEQSVMATAPPIPK